MALRALVGVLAVLGTSVWGAHGTAAASTPPDDSAAPAVTDGKWCSLNLHWASGGGQEDVAEVNDGGYWQLWPSSPDGMFWLYDGPHDFADDPDTGADEYNALVEFLAEYLDSRSCGPTLVLGYSNGGGLAAKLLCSGEDFGGRVWGYIVDDPVMDAGVLDCEPSPNVRHVLFTHSEELAGDAEEAGGDCSVTGWYCQDNTTMTVAEYEAETGYPSELQREIHSGDAGWADDELASWHQEFVFWTTYFAEPSASTTDR